MLTAFRQFNDNYKYIQELDSLYIFLKTDLKIGVDLADILRAEIVYSVSAFDKLVHDLVRIGMVECFQGTRTKTNSFKNFQVTSDTLTEIMNSHNNPSTTYPSVYWFEQEVVLRNKYISFQDPSKISEGLSYIWTEQHKWQKIALKMGQDEKAIKTTLTNIINRRNKIVHESDIDIQTGIKFNIEHPDVNYTTSFIEKLGTAIYDCIK